MKEKKINWGKIIPYLGLILVFVVFSILTKGKLVSVKNIKVIIEQSILTITAGCGVIYVLSVGGLDLSQGSIMGIGTIVIAIVSKQNIFLSVIAAIVVCGLIGLLNGFLNAKMKIASFIVTICVMYIFRGLTSFLTASGALMVSAKVFSLNNLKFKLPLLLALIIISMFVYNFTPFGEKVRLVGSGETAAWYAGINVTRIKILVFVIAGVACAMASFFNAIRTGTANANTGATFETDVLLALVIGGMPVSGGSKSRFAAVIIGAVLVAALGNGLVIVGAQSAVQQLIKGLVFLLAVAVSTTRAENAIIK